MARIIRLNESDLNKIVKKVISEQPNSIYKPTRVGGTEGHRGPGPGGVDEIIKPYTVNLEGSLFKNGEDIIDTNDQQFQKGINAIRDAIIKTSMSGGKPTIQIIGGASAVGQKQGYNNMKLATSRANNYYNIIKDKFPKVKFTVGQPVVGVQTEKGDAANKEQFVKLFISGSKTDLSTRQAIDHTAVNLNIGPNKKEKDKISTEKRYIVCFELTETELGRIKTSKMGSKIISAKSK
jgi:hypothetical protein